MGGQLLIRWSKDGEGLFYIGKHISIKDFTCTLCNKVIKVEKLLDKLFGGL